MLNQNKLATALKEWMDIFFQYSSREFIEYAKKTGLNMSQIRAMTMVHRRGSCWVSDLGDELGVSNAAASQLVEQLVQKEFVIRSEDLQDRRMKKVVLTEKGSQVVHESLRAQIKWLDSLAKMMTPQEEEQVIEAFHIISVKAAQFELTSNHLPQEKSNKCSL